MGVTRTDLFTKEQNEFAQLAKAFSHPARVAIMEYLLKANACINSDLVQELGLAQSTISQHLRELKSIGIIQGTIEGASMSYCINEETWNSLKVKFEAFFDKSGAASSGSCC